MNLITIPVGDLGVNTYLYFDSDKREGVLIDPGADAAKIVTTVQRAGKGEPLRITAILLTHGHFDHIGAVRDIQAHPEIDAPVYAARAEAELLNDPKLNVSWTLGENEIVFDPSEYLPLEDGATIPVGSHTLRVISTPGHTVGSICLYDEDMDALFSGDTLFQQSVGRANFPTGHEATLLDSIRTKLYALPAETRVYPGHGGNTSIGYEMQHNPYARPLV